MAQLPASPARIRRAWRAGLRGYSTWLTTGIAAVLGAAVLRAWAPDQHGVASRVRAALGEQGHDATAVVTALAQDGIVVLAGLFAIVLASLVLAGLALGQLGPLEPELAQGLGVPRPPVRLRAGIGLGALLLVLSSFELRARIAGAARAADAGADGLVSLWHGTALELATALGVAMIAVGVLEAWWARADRLLALQPTVEQARDEARDRGGRRR